VNKVTEVKVPTLSDWELEASHHISYMAAGDSIGAIQELKPAGPWITKSNAELSVSISLDNNDLGYFFLNFSSKYKYQRDPDIRGLRIYRVSGIPVGTIGGTEFHRQRQEMVWCVRGKVEWVCEDIYGATKEYVLENGSGVWMPPFILHTYSALLPDSELLVLCNTTFDAQDPRTHDTWGTEVFSGLQKRVRRSRYWNNKKNAPAKTRN